MGRLEMVAGIFLRLFGVALLIGVSACSSTASQTAPVDSSTGPTQQVVGPVLFGSLFNSRFVGRWTMSDRFARSCTYQFLAEQMEGSASIGKVTLSGYCTSPFDDVAGWQGVGRDVVLFGSDGSRLVDLSQAGSNTYGGRFRGPTLSIEVVMRKGLV